MSQYDGTQRGRVEGELAPVHEAQLLEALEKPAIDEEPASVSRKQELRAGHRSGPSVETEGKRHWP
jgi:hypothetical protein